jgi:hypothetical protein
MAVRRPTPAPLVPPPLPGDCCISSRPERAQVGAEDAPSGRRGSDSTEGFGPEADSQVPAAGGGQRVAAGFTTDGRVVLRRGAPSRKSPPKRVTDVPRDA